MARTYSVRVEHQDQDLSLTIQSYPQDYLISKDLGSVWLIAQHLGLESPTPLYAASSTFADGRSDELLVWTLLHLIHNPVGDWQYHNPATDPLFQLVLERPRRRDTEHSGTADEGLVPFLFEVVSAPIVAVEQSDPHFKSLAEIATMGGGAGLGILVAGGVLGPAALIVVPSGVIAITVGRRLARRIGRWIDSPERRITQWRQLRDAGDITDAEFRDAVRRIMDEDLRQEPAQ